MTSPIHLARFHWDAESRIPVILEREWPSEAEDGDI
jgi:hypothetical protein